MLAGLEAIRTLNERGIETRHPIDVVAWTNEEGSRFTPGMMPAVTPARWISTTHWIAHADGVLLRDELERAGFAGPRERQMPKAYFEAHIEQGPVLEQAGLPIGVVTGVQGIYELDVTVTGFESRRRACAATRWARRPR